MKLTPLHLSIFIAAYVGSDNSYEITDTSRKFEQDLITQGLIFRQESGELLATKYGECKMQELLLVILTPRQHSSCKDNRNETI